MAPRPYQTAAIDALHHHICTRDDNPCVVLPTAAGKSPTMAWMIAQWAAEYPALRVIVLAHVKELVQQNADKMLAIWPDADVGIYAAGLNARDKDASITFASIDSVFAKAADFLPFDVVIVDEAHRIPARGEGKYRRFITEAKLQNHRMRVVGFTATPFRMAGGPICHRDHVLNSIAYEADIRDLIADGFLSPLRSKISVSGQPNLAGVHRRGGDYVSGDLSRAIDRPELVTQAVTEALRILDAEARRHVIWFAVDIAHCEHVAAEIQRIGRQPAPVITGTTPQRQRDSIIAQFKAGRFRHLVNVNVLCEGFDAPILDAVVLLRPTKSKGLYTQMVGRGLRLHPGKTDCLVLDFAHCIDTHGPLNMIGAGRARIHLCEKCAEVFSRAIGQCPACGEPVPQRAAPESVATAKRVRKMHDDRASTANIISDDIATIDVDGVTLSRHQKSGRPDSLRISYRCGLRTFCEWLTPDHGAASNHMAREWWRTRFPGQNMPSIDDMLGDLLLPARIKAATQAVIVQPVGKYENIVGHKITPEPFDRSSQ